MWRYALALPIIFASITSPGLAQRVKITVDCKATRLDGAERETCASPGLIRLTASVDSATKRLERRLTGRERHALLDTEGPFRVERNNCQNEPAVHQCVERVLKTRLTALAAASQSPAAILAEVARASFIGVAYFRKWGDLIIGKKVHVWGCMVVEPGSTATIRTRGFIGDVCSKARGKYVPVVFTSMNEERASFYDTKSPSGYWEGVVERRGGKLVLAQVTP